MTIPHPLFGLLLGALVAAAPAKAAPLARVAPLTKTAPPAKAVPLTKTAPPAKAVPLTKASPQARAGTTPSPFSPPDTSEAETAVRDVVHAFKAALRAGDTATVLGQFHPEAIVYEGGHAETLERYRSGHLAADMAFLRETTTELLKESVRAGAALALYTSEYTVRGRFRGREVDLRGTETIVLQRTDDGWRIRHIHWSSR